MAKPRHRRIVPTLLAMVVLLFLLFHLIRLQTQIAQVRGTAAQLRAQVEMVSTENKRLADEIANASDEEFIKDIARAELGLVEPGEKVFYDTSR